MKKNEPSELFFSKTLNFLTNYLPTQLHKSQNTIRSYRDALTVFRRYITESLHSTIRVFRFRDCTYEILLGFLDYLRSKGNSEATCNYRLTAIRSYLWYAADLDISIQSIALSASHIPHLRTPKLTRETISKDDMAALLTAPPATKKGKRDQVILVLLYDSAIRVSELLDLDVRSINLNAEIPYIRVLGKGEKERIVSITDRTVDHIRAYLKLFHPENDPDQPFIYTEIKGCKGRMSVGNVERIIKKYVEELRPTHPELPKTVYPHMFRRTRSTNLYQDGVELELISRILGHSSTETTRIYAVPSMEMMRKAMESGTLAVNEEQQWPENDDEIAKLCGLR